LPTSVCAARGFGEDAAFFVVVFFVAVFLGFAMNVVLSLRAGTHHPATLSEKSGA
jgi:hypothetical protein